MSELMAELNRVLAEFVRQVVLGAPTIIVLLVVALASVLLALIFERVLVMAGRRPRTTAFLAHIGFTGWLQRAGVQRDAPAFIGRIGFYLLLTLFIRTAAYTLELVPIADALGTLLGYIPELLAATLILLLGNLAARVAAAVVSRTAEGAGSDVSKTLATLTYGVVMYAVAIMALSQLGIETEVIRVFSVIVLSSIGLGFALAFGPAARDSLANVIASYYVRRTFPVGTQVRFAEGDGAVERIAPTQVFVATRDEVISLPSRVFLSRVKRHPKK